MVLRDILALGREGAPADELLGRVRSQRVVYRRSVHRVSHECVHANAKQCFMHVLVAYNAKSSWKMKKYGSMGVVGGVMATTKSYCVVMSTA